MYATLTRRGTANPGPARRTWRRRLTLAAAACTALLALAACGDSSAADSPASGAGASGGEIRVGVSSGSDNATPFYAAYQLGYFKDAGLDVTYTLISGGDTAISAALDSNSLDVSLQSASQWISDIAKQTVTGKIVGEYTDVSYAILAGPDIKSPEDLKGKVIGISSPNNGDQIYLEAVLGHYGITKSDVDWLALGAPPTRLSALVAGKIDALEMPITQIPDSAKQYVLLTPEQSPVPVVSQAVFANQSFIDNNKEDLKKFMAAIGKASTWVRNNQQEAVQYCQMSQATEENCNTTIAAATAANGNPYTWSSTWGLNVPGFEATLDAVGEVVPQAATLTTDDILDTSIAGTTP